MKDRGDPVAWVIEPLGKHHDRAAFACGKEVLDLYLKNHASQDARRRVAAPFVLLKAPGSTTVLGYYTLTAFAVDLGDLPEVVARKLPHYPSTPVTLLGRLGLDRRYHGQGLGEALLMDALYRSLVQSAEIAAAAVVVDAMDEEAWRFYRHFNFIPFPERRDRLLLAMRTVEALFR